MILMLLAIGACGTDRGPSGGQATAHGVADRSQLVGGDRALGDIGDIVMENEKIRLVIQKEGFSRGFGVYGGGLIDADLRRPREPGTSGAATGYDQFAELFPAFFVEAVNVDQVKVLDDGTSGGPARVEASGVAGDFLELVAVLNRAVTGSNTDYRDPDSPPRIRYSTVYELAPGKSYVDIHFKVENISDRALAFPAREAGFLFNILGLPTQGFTVPIGDIGLFGATSKVFIPGIGFDLRFGLERAYAKDIDFPAFPGIATEFIASRGDHASYGLIASESDRNYVYNKREFYEDGRTPITRSTMLVPFVASSFLGIFYEEAPPSLAVGQSFEIVKHFIVGSGDVGSVLDTINEIRGAATGRLAGQVFEEITAAPGAGLSVVVYQRLADGTRRPYSQYDVHEGGFFGGTLVPGDYSLKVVGPARKNSAYTDFAVAAGETTSLTLSSPAPARIFVNIRDDRGVALPAKATAIGVYDAQYVGQLTPQFLFDLEAGDDFRSTDLLPDDANDPSTREYIEGIGFTANGLVELSVRPGEYDIVSSRGPEYDTARSHVTVGPGETATVSHRLKRVVDTRGWVALDSHIHSRASIDSPMSLDERVAALAAEGVEVAVATDHNYITDYAPYVARNGLNEWLHPVVGLEMTTLESGHFNGYPLKYQVGPITHGAFEWARRPPDSIFEELRNLGNYGPDNTIVQVNHPRDDLLGYYTQYSRSPLTGDQIPPSFLDQFISPTGPAFLDEAGKTTFSFNYDAVELLNGKLFYEIHHYRVPEQLPPGELPSTIPPAGTILRDADGDVAFRGVVDDWFNLLNKGYKYVGVGTGDSHSGFDEPGQFRTMVYVGVDNAQAINDRMLVEGLRSRRVIATDGPMLEFWVNDPDYGAIGQTLSDGDGTVAVTYRLSSAPWISMGRLNIYRNGVIARTVEIDQDRDLSADPLEETVELELARDGQGQPIDSWFVIEAIGYRSMHPVIRTQEIPPLLLTDALASLAGPLGFGNDEFGDLRPPEVFPVTGYAITNPVWVTTDGGDFTPPGVVPFEIQNLPENYSRLQEGVYAQSPISPRTRIADQRTRVGRVDLPGQRSVPLFYPRSGNWADVRKIMARLGALGRHGPQ